MSISYFRCNNCQIEKHTDCYRIRAYKRKKGITYKRIKICRTCELELSNLYYQDHIEERREYSKNYYKENKLNPDAKDKKSAYDKQHYLLNAEKKKAQTGKYAKENNIKINNNKKRRRQTDVTYKLKYYFSNRIRKVLKSVGRKKDQIKYLVYSFTELKNYIESLFEWWMTWENWGVYNKKTWNDNDPSTWTWNIDHIIPQSKLPFSSTKDENFKKCWALENLRPLSAKENIYDGARR